MQAMQALIEQAWEDRAGIRPGQAPARIGEAVDFVLNELDNGRLRVAEKVEGRWVTHAWIKKAVLLSFKLADNRVLDDGVGKYFDKVTNKFAHYDAHRFNQGGYRVLPQAQVRRGCFLAPEVLLMPCFVDSGAYLDAGTVVGAWSTIGSCAQIGKHVHLAGGVDIGGVLEPLAADPTVIEDNCHLGAGSAIVDGVLVEANSVIAMGVNIGPSTKIYDSATGEVSYGRVPAGSVVVPGTLPAADGKHSLYCAVIVKRVDAQTRSRVGIDELLRGD